jgi:hypothetical protein
MADRSRQKKHAFITFINWLRAPPCRALAKYPIFLKLFFPDFHLNDTCYCFSRKSKAWFCQKRTLVDGNGFPYEIDVMSMVAAAGQKCVEATKR